jgi:hypothetical protein
MKSIASAAVLLLAVFSPTAHIASAQAQSRPQPNPNIVVEYIEPRPPIDPQAKDYADNLAGYQRFMKIHQRMKQRQVLEEFSAFLSPLKLPRTLHLRTKACGVMNAYYDEKEWTVNICYEWIDATEQMAPQTTSEGFSRQEVIIGGLIGVTLHELGHAINDLYNIPVLGREEDSADQIAGFVMLQFGKDVARTAIKGMAYVWLGLQRQVGDSYGYWNVHSTPGQRFYNYLCIGYGGAPEAFQDQVDQWLSKDRVVTCPHEYQQVKNAFVKTILPHIDQDLMHKVQATKWLQSGDGKWD